MKPYQRGDIVEIDVPIPVSGHVQGGKRPGSLSRTILGISSRLPALLFR